MRFSKLVHLTLALVLCLYAYELVRAWHALPERVASHFDGAGQPNGWSSKGSFMGISVAVGVLMPVMGWGLVALVARTPVSWISLPNRDYWLAPERRAGALRRLGEHMVVFTAATTVLLWLVMRQVITFNLAPTDAGLGSGMWWYMGGYFAFLAGWMIWLYRAFALPRD